MTDTDVAKITGYMIAEINRRAAAAARGICPNCGGEGRVEISRDHADRHGHWTTEKMIDCPECTEF